jgi:hypothetical protein
MAILHHQSEGCMDVIQGGKDSNEARTEQEIVYALQSKTPAAAASAAAISAISNAGYNFHDRFAQRRDGYHGPSANHQCRYWL